MSKVQTLSHAAYSYSQGILTPGNLLYIVGKAEPIAIDLNAAPYVGRDVPDVIAALCALYRLESIWLMFGHSFASARNWNTATFGPESRSVYYYWLNPYRKDTFGAVTLTMPSGLKCSAVNCGLENRWPFLSKDHADLRADEMAAIMLGLRTAFDTPHISITPSGQALPYLFKSLGNVTAGDTSTFYTHLVGRDLVWRYPSQWDYARAKYVHLFDCNAQYLAAAARTELGIGDPVLVADMDSDPRVPAFYTGAYSLRPLEFINPFDNALQTLADMTGNGGLSGFGEYDACLWRLARDRHIETRIDHGVTWPEYKRVLRKYGETLWSRRQEAKALGTSYAPLLEQSIKVAANAGLGRISKTRPDWYFLLISEARRASINVLRAALGVNLFPVAWYIDCGVFLSDDEQPALPALMGKPTSLGGYKHKATLAMTPAIAERLTTQTPVELMGLVNHAS